MKKNIYSSYYIPKPLKLSQNCPHSFLGSICKVAIFIITVNIWQVESDTDIKGMWIGLCTASFIGSHYISPSQIFIKNTSRVVCWYFMRTITQTINPSILLL